MKRPNRSRIHGGIGALLWAASSTTWSAAGAAVEPMAVRAYPVKSIRFIVAAPPGGAADTLTRLLAPKLSEAWAAPLVVDNRPGANGIIGAEKTARAAADGYTVAMVAANFAISPSLYARVPYDPVRDFAPVTQVAMAPYVLLVIPALAVNSVPELLNQARTKPGGIVFASAGKGTTGHLALELLQTKSATRYTHVSQKSTESALAELLSAQAHALFGIASVAMPHVRAGRLRALAVTSAMRARALPELPTMAESGLAGFDATTWFGVLTPAQTPGGIVAKLNAEIVRALRSPEVAARMGMLAAEPVGSTPSEFAAHIAAEAQKWARLIKQAGIRAE